MTRHWLFVLLTGVAAVVGPATVRAEFPERVEARLRQDLARTLSGGDYGASYRACLLTHDEVLVELTLQTAKASDPGRDFLAVEKARQQVNKLLGTSYPELKLSSLSSFKLKGQQPSELLAHR